MGSKIMISNDCTFKPLLFCKSLKAGNLDFPKHRTEVFLGRLHPVSGMGCNAAK
jgi:hypothetical protein